MTLKVPSSAQAKSGSDIGGSGDPHCIPRCWNSQDKAEVCGSDGVTYPKECLPKCLGASVRCRGRCPCKEGGEGIEELSPESKCSLVTFEIKLFNLWEFCSCLPVRPRLQEGATQVPARLRQRREDILEVHFFPTFNV